MEKRNSYEKREKGRKGKGKTIKQGEAESKNAGKRKE